MGKKKAAKGATGSKGASNSTALIASALFAVGLAVVYTQLPPTPASSASVPSA